MHNNHCLFLKGEEKKVLAGCDIGPENIIAKIGISGFRNHCWISPDFSLVEPAIQG